MSTRILLVATILTLVVQLGRALTVSPTTTKATAALCTTTVFSGPECSCPTSYYSTATETSLCVPSATTCVTATIPIRAYCRRNKDFVCPDDMPTNTGTTTITTCAPQITMGATLGCTTTMTYQFGLCTGCGTHASTMTQPVDCHGCQYLATERKGPVCDFVCPDPQPLNSGATTVLVCATSSVDI